MKIASVFEAARMSTSRQVKRELAASRNAALLYFPGTDPKEHTASEEETRRATRRRPDKWGKYTWITAELVHRGLWKFGKCGRDAHVIYFSFCVDDLVVGLQFFFLFWTGTWKANPDFLKIILEFWALSWKHNSKMYKYAVVALMHCSCWIFNGQKSGAIRILKLA